MAEVHQAGVTIVPAELASMPDMTVHENLSAGKERRRLGVLDRRRMISEA